VDKDKKPVKPSGLTTSPASDDLAPAVGPNKASAEEMPRSKPNQEAITAALQAMQRLTMKMDSELAVEETTPQTTFSSSTTCASCGHSNREGTRFCGMCGLPVRAAAAQSNALDAARSDSPGLEFPTRESSDLELPDFARELTEGQVSATEQAQGPHGSEHSSSGTHHYHHHYHHHYFSGGVDAAAPRVNAPESAREADRLRIAAAAKGEPMSRSEAAVRRLTQEWVLACNTRQLDELIELYSPDALVVRSNVPLLRGAAAVREFFFSALESGLGEVALEPMRVEVVGDLAHEVGRYSALVPGIAGSRREERGKYLWVFAKQSGGEWKLISECWSSDLTLANPEPDAPKAVIAAASKGLPRKG
jgi:uncharacterized protein (TIGR02246 family)